MPKKTAYDQLKEIIDKHLRDTAEIREAIKKSLNDREKSTLDTKDDVRRYYEKCYWTIYKKGMVFWIFVASLAIFIISVSTAFYLDHKEAMLIQQEINSTGTGVEI